MDALAFWKMQVFVRIGSLLDDSAHLSDHMRKKRLELGLFQDDIAKILKVSTETITNWENRHSFPKISNMPAIIDFLGYNPMQVDQSTLGGMVKTYRLKHGLSHKKLGNQLNVDASTVGSWEMGIEPHKKTKKKLLKLLG
jgi:DNA-binding transcriptional regulator YiaG